MRKMAAASQQLRAELDQMMVLSSMRPGTPGSPPKDSEQGSPSQPGQGSVPPSPHPARKYPQIKEPGASTRGRSIVNPEVCTVPVLHCCLTCCRLWTASHRYSPIPTPLPSRK